MKRILLFLLMCFFMCSCDVTFRYFWMNMTGQTTQYGGGSYNPADEGQRHYEWIHSQKQELGKNRYSITSIEKMSNGKYVLIGTDRNTFETGAMVFTQQKIDEILMFETKDTNWIRIGW